jgi:hypothetical protein
MRGGNEHFKVGHADTAVPRYFVGGLSANYQDPSIGYFVRISQSAELANPTPWLVSKHRQVFVNGRRSPHSQCNCGERYRGFHGQDNGCKGSCCCHCLHVVYGYS